MATKKQSIEKKKTEQHAEDNSKVEFEKEQIASEVSEVKKTIEKVAEEVAEDDFSSIFIDDTQTFEIKLKVYKDKTIGEYMVEDVDPDFDYTNDGIKEFSVMLKHPSYADKEIIRSQVGHVDFTELGVNDFIKLEENRLFTLIREWDFPSPVRQIHKMNPKFITGMCAKVRQEIGLNGIV